MPMPLLLDGTKPGDSRNALFLAQACNLAYFDAPGGGDGEVIRSQVHPIRVAKQGDVDMVVDDEQRSRRSRQIMDSARQLQEPAPGQALVTQLKDVRSSTQGSSRQLDNTVWRRVRSNDVQVGSAQLL